VFEFVAEGTAAAEESLSSSSIVKAIGLSSKSSSSTDLFTPPLDFDTLAEPDRKLLNAASLA
jgi:hypothetical protein